jgi:hypothetical protein
LAGSEPRYSTRAHKLLNEVDDEIG